MVNKVDFVIDGDTTYSADAQQSRRLHGVQAPEILHDGKGFAMAGGDEASEKLGALLAANPDAIWESMGKDVHGRDLGRYVTKEGKDLNEVLVREGYAQAMDFNDDVSPYRQAQSDYIRDLSQGKVDYFVQGDTFKERGTKDLTIPQEFGEGIQRGIDQTQGLLGFGLSALAKSIGMDSLANYGEELAIRNFEEAQEHAATIGTYKDVNFDEGILSGLGKAGRFAVGILGEQVPQIGFDILAAAGTGGLGALGTAAVKRGIKEGIASHIANTASKATFNKGLLASMTVQQIGEVEAELQANGIDAPLTAIVGGIGAGAVDFFGAKILMKSAHKMFEKGKPAKGSMLLTQGLKNTALEGATEGVQTLMAKSAVWSQKAGYDIFSDDNIEETLNAVLAGMIVGGAPVVARGSIDAGKAIASKLPSKKIEDQNRQILGQEIGQTDAVSASVDAGVETPSVKVSGIDSEGNSVTIVDEATSPENVEVLKASGLEKAEKAGLSDVKIEESTAAEVVDSRDGELSQNGDHVLESVDDVISHIRGAKTSGKKAALSDKKVILGAKEKAPELFDDKSFIIEADDGRAFFINNEEDANHAIEVLADSDPKFFVASEYGAKPKESDKATKEPTDEEQSIAVPFGKKTEDESEDKEEKEVDSIQPHKVEKPKPVLAKGKLKIRDANAENVAASITADLRSAPKVPKDIRGLREFVNTRVYSAVGVDESPAYVDDITEMVLSQYSDESSVDNVEIDAAPIRERLDVKKVEEAFSEFSKNSAIEDSISDEDSTKVDEEFLRIVTPAEDDDAVAKTFAEGAAAALDKARKIVRKKVIRDTPLAEFEAAGFADRESFLKAKRVIRQRELLDKDLGQKDTTFAGGKFDNVFEDILFSFRKIADAETGEHIPDSPSIFMYLPEAIKAINESALSRFYSTAVNSFGTRAITQFSAFVEYMSDRGYIPENFSDTNKAHIAYPPSYSNLKRGMSLADLKENAKSFYKDTGSDAIDFMEVSHEQERIDMLTEIDRAIDRAIKAKTEQSVHYDAVETLFQNFEALLDKQESERDEFDKQQYGSETGDIALGIASDAERFVTDPASKLELPSKEPTPKKKASKDDVKTIKERLSKAPQKAVSFKEKVNDFVRSFAEDAGIVSPLEIRYNPEQKQVAQVLIENGKATIIFNKDKLEGISNDNPDAAIHIIAHEVGHVFVAETMHNIPEDVLSGLHKSFRKAKSSVPSGHPYRKGEGVGFDEWLSDQFAIHMSKPLGKNADTFFDTLVKVLTKIANTLSPIFGVNRLHTSRSGQAFMESMFRAGVKNKTVADSEFMDSLASMNLEFGGSYPRSRAENRRFIVENKALGHKTTGLVESKERRDFTLGQNLNKTSDLGRAAINKMGRIGKSVISDPSYIPTQAMKFFDFSKKAAPIAHTTYSLLKGIPAVKHLAKKYRRIFEESVADSSLWQNEAHASFVNASSEEIKAFLSGTAGVPQSITKFMDKFHKKLSKDMPTLGYIKGYFPRAYDTQYIEQNRSKLESLLVVEAAKKGVPFTEANATQAVDSILQDAEAALGLLEDTAIVFGNDPFSQKTRVLDFISDETLRANKMLRGDIDNVMTSYVHRMVRRAAFEREMSGYSDISAITDSAGKQRNAASFTKALFVGFPFRNSNGRLYTSAEKSDIFGKADAEFFVRNRKYFSIASDKGWIREIGSESDKKWQYYDKNKALRTGYRAITDESDKKQFVKIVDALEGRIGSDKISPKTRDAMSNILAYQNLVILPFSGFAQLAEISGLVFRSRDIEGAFAALKEIYNVVFTAEGRERRGLMRDLGFAHKQLAQQAMLESYGVNYQSPTAQKINDFLFTANGMNFITNSSRILGGAIAERFIQRHAARAANGNARSVRYLRELGLTKEQADYANSSAYKPYNHFTSNGDLTSEESLKSEAVHKAMFKFVDSSIVRPNATQRPVWASDPRFMILWHLKSFMYAYGSTILGGLGSEINARWKESRKSGLSKAQSAAAASIPFMVYAIPVLMMSGLALELRDLIQHTILGLGSRPYSDSLHGADYIMELVSRGGALGPMEMAYSFTEDMDKGRSPIVGLLGPTVQQLDVFLSGNPAEIINRSTPILSQNPLYKDMVRELLRD